MIGAGLPIRCVALEADGEYDTHADESSSLQTALDLTATSLLAFQRDLEARGVADRVMTLVWTEFGRRAEENGSGGTDHGAAGTAFLIGARAAGRMVGEFPGLAHGLDADGNLKPTVDFRGVYTSLLEQWLSFDAEKIIPGASGFARPRLIRRRDDAGEGVVRVGAGGLARRRRDGCAAAAAGLAERGALDEPGRRAAGRSHADARLRDAVRLPRPGAGGRPVPAR